MGSVIVVPSDWYELCNPSLSENHGDHLNPSYTTPWDTIHLVDELPYEQIDARLSIGVPLAQACIARALVSISVTLDDKQPTGPEPPMITEAEAILRKEYTSYRGRRALCLAVSLPLPGDHHAQPRPWYRGSYWLGRWFGVPPAQSENRRILPPAITFDEWLRHRTGRAPSPWVPYPKRTAP